VSPPRKSTRNSQNNSAQPLKALAWTDQAGDQATEKQATEKQAAPKLAVSKKTMKQEQQTAQTEASSSSSTSASTCGGGKGSGRWTAKEQQQFLSSFAIHGKDHTNCTNDDWRKIAESIPTRDATQVRTHAQKYFKNAQKPSQKTKTTTSKSSSSSSSSNSNSKSNSSSSSRVRAVQSSQFPAVAEYLAVSRPVSIALKRRRLAEQQSLKRDREEEEKEEKEEIKQANKKEEKRKNREQEAFKRRRLIEKNRGRTYGT
jgi:hypothetical protein